MADNQNDLCDLRIIHRSRIAKAREEALDTDTIDQLAQLFKVIADPGRIKILKALEYQEMCVCDLAAFLEVSESAASHQLRMLRQLQLVTNRRKGPVLYYSLQKTMANSLLDSGLKLLEGQ